MAASLGRTMAEVQAAAQKAASERVGFVEDPGMKDGNLTPAMLAQKRGTAPASGSASGTSTGKASAKSARTPSPTKVKTTKVTATKVTPTTVAKSSPASAPTTTTTGA